MIRTLALRSSSLADTVYELTEQPSTCAAHLFDALKGDGPGGAVAGREGLADTNRTAGKRRGWGSGQPLAWQRQTNRACDAMAEKSRRLASNRKLGDAAAIISLGNPDELIRSDLKET